MRLFKLLPAILALIFALGQTADAQVTFSEHIAPIIYNNCTNCHRPGEVGPIPLTNYSEVSAWAGMIEYVTEIKYMPPWPPDAEYSHFINERTLADSEIQLIKDWVDQGAVQGDPTLEPPLPTFPTGSQIGIPDLTLTMASPHTVVGDNTDDYRVFVLPTGFTEDKEIAAIEFRPDNNRAVHHVLFAYDETGAAAAMDASTPEYGYYSFGDFGVDEAVYLTWSYVPGNSPLIYPEGIGEIIPAGADLLIQVHYAPLPTDETDQSSINIFFKEADDPITREVITGAVWPFNLPGGWFSFQIPPNQVKTFTAIDFYQDDLWVPGVDYDISLIGVDPHSHYLGKSYEVYVVTPDNDTINVINIPDWDFNWQGSYTFNRMKKIPANSTWYTVASYDNTTSNPANPSDPPINVTWGEGTNDEMLLVGFYYVPYEEGDENIVIGNEGSTGFSQLVSPTNSALQAPSPNPTSGNFEINFSLEQAESLQFDLLDASGQLIRKVETQNFWSKGTHALQVNAADLARGNYLIRMQGEGYVLHEKLLIIK